MVPQLGGPGPPAVGGGGALPHAIAMVWYRRGGGEGKGERERGERMRGGGQALFTRYVYPVNMFMYSSNMLMYFGSARV